MKTTINQRNLILFMSIGDGYLDKQGYLFILHCEKQLKYLEWKKKLLEKNGFICSEIKYKKNNNFNAYKFKTHQYNFIKLYRKYIYKNNKKQITRKILNRLTPLGLAIWYMDDGGLSQKKQKGKVHANDLMLNTGLTKQENQIIIDYFQEEWGIKFTQVKNHNTYRLRCGTKNARKFINIIYDYVKEVGCFDYKLNIKL